METTRKKLSELHKTTKNIRKHNTRQIAEYVRSLNMFGQIRPLVVTDDGEILAGNGAYDAMLSMGWTECDVYVVSGLTEAQKRKLMLADNKVYELGATDLSTLDDLVREIGDFDVPGFDEDLLKLIADNTREITEALEGYGVVENTPTEVQARRDPSEYGQTASALGGNTPYAPVSENKAAGVAQVDSGDTRPYVMCPNCGCKIWL